MSEPGTASLDLSVQLGRGLVLPNPVGLASGTAGYGFELAQLIDLDRVGALYTKGTTRRPRTGFCSRRLRKLRANTPTALSRCEAFSSSHSSKSSTLRSASQRSVAQPRMERSYQAR